MWERKITAVPRAFLLKSRLNILLLVRDATGYVSPHIEVFLMQIDSCVNA